MLPAAVGDLNRQDASGVIASIYHKSSTSEQQVIASFVTNPGIRLTPQGYQLIQRLLIMQSLDLENGKEQKTSRKSSQLQIDHQDRAGTFSSSPKKRDTIVTGVVSRERTFKQESRCTMAQSEEQQIMSGSMIKVSEDTKELGTSVIQQESPSDSD